MLKVSTLLYLLLISLDIFSQRQQSYVIDNNDTIMFRQTRYLQLVDGLDSLKNDKSIIYGSFVQRHGIKDDRYIQRIILKNTDLKKFVMINVDILNRYKRHKFWFFHIPPGNYEIVRYDFCNYYYYFSSYKKETVVIDNKATERRNYSDSTFLEESFPKIKRFKFKIEPGTVNYVGVWNFYEDDPFFFDSKTLTDKKFKKTYIRLDLEKAIKTIPQ